VVVVVGLTILGGALVLGGGGAPPAGVSVEIRNMEGETMNFGLSDDRTVRMDGPLGTTVISIRNRRVSFQSSPCPHNLCVDHEPISRTGDWIACLPNGVVARIGGEARYDCITP
jgi:hypothetical protein